MSKLEDFTGTAGMNAGASVYAKMARTADIQTDPELSGIFAISEETLAAVTMSMKERGYDKAEPVVVWKGRNIVVDGHTRLKAAGEAGIMEIPVEEKEFESIEKAVLYAYGRQANRRNLTQAEIYNAAVALKDKAERDGNGRAAEKLAKALDIAASTVYRARAIDEKADPEVIEAVKNGDMSINQAYQRIRKQKKTREESGNDYNPPEPELETGEGPETGAADPLEQELPEISESIDIALPEDDGSFAETETQDQPEGESESGILSMIDRAIETLETFLENREGEDTGKLREALQLLQKIHERYITDGEPS